MPEYRKKRRNRFLTPHPKGKEITRKNDNKDNDIVMKSENGKKIIKPPKNANMRVVKGKKMEKKKKLSILSIILAAVLVVVIVLEMILPAGIVRTAKNLFALIGTGSYPIEFESSDTIDVVPMSGYYYVVSNSQLYAYTNAGKELYNYSHGFEKPILKTSRWGALLFNQGDTRMCILTIDGEQKVIETEDAILNAALSDCGGYVVATESTSYKNTVSVYNKNDKNLFEWYSADQKVTHVAIDSNAKKIAVATFDASVGEFNSKVKVLNFKSADPEYTLSIDGSLVYDLSAAATGYFTVASANKLHFVKWKNYKNTEYKNDYSCSLLRNSSKGTVAVWSRESDRSDNIVTVFSKSGELKYEFRFEGIISDIRLYAGHIYCMSDTKIYLLDEDGKILRKASSGFGGVKTVVTGSNSVLSITDNKIEKLKLEEE